MAIAGFERNIAPGLSASANIVGKTTASAMVRVKVKAENFHPVRDHVASLLREEANEIGASCSSRLGWDDGGFVEIALEGYDPKLNSNAIKIVRVAAAYFSPPVEMMRNGAMYG